MPRETVQLGGKGPYLFVLQPDQTVEQRLVIQGPRFGDLTVISQGVQASETVVVEGQLALGNGLKVNPSRYQPSGPAPSRSPGLTENTGGGIAGPTPPPDAPKAKSAL